MNTLIFATNNLNKVIEVRSLLSNSFTLLSLQEANIIINIPEPFNTLEENAIEKASVIYNLTKTNCFSEDTGLEVKALNGHPGVKSARYAGNNRSADANIQKLLNNMHGIKEREAQFRTVICLIIKGKHTIFEGICKGIIIDEKRGGMGFGYDSVFIPGGSQKTFAEMLLQEKNVFSHRKKAIEKLIYFLTQVKNV